MIDLLLKFFGGGIGQAVGGGIANTVSLVALAPVAYWFVDHKDETLVVVNYGTGAIVGLLLFVIIKIVHYTSPVKG
jgi:hypothetical protein